MVKIRIRDPGETSRIRNTAELLLLTTIAAPQMRNVYLICVPYAQQQKKYPNCLLVLPEFFPLVGTSTGGYIGPPRLSSLLNAHLAGAGFDPRTAVRRTVSSLAQFSRPWFPFTRLSNASSLCN